MALEAEHQEAVATMAAEHEARWDNTKSTMAEAEAHNSLLWERAKGHAQELTDLPSRALSLLR